MKQYEKYLMVANKVHLLHSDLPISNKIRNKILDKLTSKVITDVFNKVSIHFPTGSLISNQIRSSVKNRVNNGR